MMHSTVRGARTPAQRKQRAIAVLAAAFMGASTSASAVDFEVGPFEGSIQSLITFGAAWRMQDRASYLIGKANLNPGICVQAVPGALDDGTVDPGDLMGGTLGSEDSCSTTNFEENLAFVRAPGSFSQNGDNGNLNYDKYDVVSAGAKLNSEITFDLGPVSFYANPIYIFDAENSNFDEFHPDTTLQPQRTARPAAVEALSGNRFDFNGYHATMYLPFIGDRELLLRVGEQGINWGESTALVFNSINAINPPDGTRARFPGFQLEEAFQPVGMAVFSTDITSNLFVEGFYQYEWKPAIADPVGTFFSTSDIAGAGGAYAMLSFAKQPEDPEQLFYPLANSADPLGITASGNAANSPQRFASRTILRVDDIEPEDGGQYGISFRYFAESLNNGTELAFYFANYHARIPSVSAYAANPTCIGPDTTDAATVLAVDCGIVPNTSAQEEIVPVGSATLAVDYPEDIKLYGFSFNTTVGDLAFSGEYSYRSNLPVQVASTDLVYAALQPAFPQNTVAIPGVGSVGSRRAAVPDFVNTIYRDNPVNPNGSMTIDGEEVFNYYIPGFERQKVHQLQFTLLNTFGGANWLNASQIITIFEFGGTYFPDMPALSELQFNGAETNTHITAGADATDNGIFSFDRLPAGDACRPENAPPGTDPGPGRGGVNSNCLQNPTAAPLDHFPTEFSWGYRAVALLRYQNALFGANIEPLIGVFHDVQGIAPGVGQNFSEGNMQILTGLRFDYLNKWVGEVRLTTFTGGSDRNARSDRDNLSAFIGYNF